jgi:hypothetical protein
MTYAPLQLRLDGISWRYARAINPLPKKGQSASLQYVFFGGCHHTERVCPAMTDQSLAYQSSRKNCASTTMPYFKGGRTCGSAV